MTNLFQRIVAFFMSVIALFSGLSPLRDKDPTAAVAVLYTGGTLAGNSGACTSIPADASVPVNCLLLREDGNHIKEFTLEAYANGAYTLVTKGDTVGAYRLCSFNSIAAEAFRLTVTACTEENFTLSGIELCTEEASNSAFRVVSYLVANGIDSSYKPDTGWLQTSTDVILFGLGNFDEEGNVTVENIQNLPWLIQKCRSINPALRIHINFLGPRVDKPTWEESMAASEKLHKNAMVLHRARFIKNLCAVLDTYELDGLYFDWEYPLEKESRYVFSSFLADLDVALGEKELGAALSGWCSELTPRGIAALDSVEMMAYDAFDDFGYHAPFSAGYSNVAQFLANGFRKEQLHLGLAFYARPTDKGGYWPTYHNYAEQLGKYNNYLLADFNGEPMEMYFNSVQLIRDKTAYAEAASLGGVMIWNMACDMPYESPLSLYRAIHDTLQ